MNKLNSFADLQAFIEGIMEQNSKPGAPPPHSPHGPYWKLLTYDEFVNGTVPHVKEPGTGAAIPILVKGNAASSNIIHALKGEGPLFGPNGAFGQMPAGGRTKFTADQIQSIADWIDAGCPEK